MTYIAGFIITIIFFIVLNFFRRRSTIRFEKEKIIPILDNLYLNPKSIEKQRQFIKILGDLDKKLEKYQEFFSYTPGKLITKKLIKHCSQKPKDILAHERFLEIIKRTKETSDFMLEEMLKYLAKNPEDELAHKRFMRAANKCEHLNSTDIFKELLKQDIINYTPYSKKRLIVCAEKAYFLQHDLINPLIDYLNKYPINVDSQNIFKKCITNIMLLPESDRKRIYNTALEILEDNPSNSSAKQFVLNIGRWHFGKSRQNGRLTFYDEQRIQNDILARAE